MVVPLLLGAAAIVPAGWVFGSDQWVYFLIAFGLYVPAGLVVVLLQDYLIRASPFGRVAALAAGTAIRLAACFGGGVVIFLLVRPEEKKEKLAFWIWILFAYLTALVVETAIFAKKRDS